MNSDREALIRERAYAIWMAEGRVSGKHEEHWHRAQQELEIEDRQRDEARRGSGPAEAGPHRPVQSRPTSEAAPAQPAQGGDQPGRRGAAATAKEIADEATGQARSRDAQASGSIAIAPPGGELPRRMRRSGSTAAEEIADEATGEARSRRSRPAAAPEAEDGGSRRGRRGGGPGSSP